MIRRTTPGNMAVLWALAGVAALFASAVIRLGGRGIETIVDGLAPIQWVALAVLTFVMVYGEGVVALQRRWVPRLIERARDLKDERFGLQLLAPLYGLSLVGAPAPRLIRAWLGTAAIVAAILVIRSIPDPWRGIVDFSVAAALGWGLVSIACRAPHAFRS